MLRHGFHCGPNAGRLTFVLGTRRAFVFKTVAALTMSTIAMMDVTVPDKQKLFWCTQPYDRWVLETPKATLIVGGKHVVLLAGENTWDHLGSPAYMLITCTNVVTIIATTSPR